MIWVLPRSARPPYLTIRRGNTPWQGQGSPPASPSRVPRFHFCNKLFTKGYWRLLERPLRRDTTTLCRSRCGGKKTGTNCASQPDSRISRAEASSGFGSYILTLQPSTEVIRRLVEMDPKEKNECARGQNVSEPWKICHVLQLREKMSWT